MLIGSTAMSNAAGTVSVYLTGLKFGSGKTINATSGNKSIDAATSYKYKLDGTVRGTPGTPLAKIVKIGTPIKDFVEFVKPGGSQYLEGTYSNPGGTLPVTLISKTYTKTKNIKGYGNVKFTLKVVGSIDANGICKLDITNVKIKTTAGQNLGSIVFSKGSALTVTALP
jgi:hypothetical protein